ncbi:hypothetical protein EYF80_065827 [Liparis tanakae]|uniref:Uncharacterized protein n=1 Tax=Liparis tanakae TaxID=230148 RepID=A0A4Z2E629_9TELE|nr:hypothetical protein EYF80_065827 [Liparis tanakae]
MQQTAQHFSNINLIEGNSLFGMLGFLPVELAICRAPVISFKDGEGRKEEENGGKEMDREEKRREDQRSDKQK